MPAVALRALAGVLRAEDFTEDGLRALWGGAADDALRRSNAAPARWRMRGDDRPLAVLARLFVLDTPVPRADVRRVLGGPLVAGLEDAGILADAATDAMGAELTLTPYAVPTGVPRGLRPGDDTVLLLADHGTLTRPDPLPGDYVLGLGGAGRTLAQITPRTRVDTAVDLGTGCGIQALLLARHARRVIATDISPRALRITALNLALNEADGVELRLGSLFEPVPEAVDLLVSNPPFVITPRTGAAALEYRDGGMTGDGIMRALLEQTPRRLAPDGHAVLLGNWEHGAGRTTPDRWLPDDPAASTMVIERERLDPAEYAETWIRDGGVARAGRRWNADTAAWLADFDSRGVDGVGFGWVRIHRLEAGDAPEDGRSALRSFERLDGPLGANALGVAAHLDTRLAMLEWLHDADDDELAATAFIRSGDVTEHRHLVPGAEAPTMLTIEQGTGFGRTFASDPALSGFLGVADGSLTLATVSAALAQLLEVGESELRAQLIEQIRGLVPAGVVYPVESGA